MQLGLRRRPAAQAAVARETGTPLTHAAYLARTYMPELDGLRAISILAVITAHMHTDIWDWLEGGRGVYLFFILSGFLITRLCLLEEANRGQVSFMAFYIRRGFRLLPAYYIVLAAYSVLILVVGLEAEKRDLFVGALPYFALYMSEVPGILGVNGQVADVPFSHSWSLGIEEKFYLVFPILIFGLLRIARDSRLAVTGTLMLFFMATPFLAIGDAAKLLYPYSNILVGCFLALLLHNERVFGYLRVLGGAWPTLGLLTLFLILQFVHAENVAVSTWPVFFDLKPSLYALSAMLLFTCILLGGGWLRTTLSWSPLVFIGKISYGIYLIHRLCLNPVEDFLGADGGGVAVNVLAYVLASAVSVAAAYTLYLVLERPCNRFGHAWSRRIQEASSRDPATVIVRA